MKSFFHKFKYGYLKWQSQKKLPVYIFEKDKTHYLKYKRELHPKIRSFLNLVRDLLGWIVAQRKANDEINEHILNYLGLDPNTDITSLDAFYKREFRKKKYMYFFPEKPSQKFPEPFNFLFEYVPSAEGQLRQEASKNAFNRFFKK